eukprot:GHVT01101711.1.p2 GENE.GHVT01101711.1~~GHVT01101711.1.p2  ORF type:complete len:110 (+),score=26.13 GHVT01101711.1:263-592(+)
MAGAHTSANGHGGREAGGDAAAVSRPKDTPAGQRTPRDQPDEFTGCAPTTHPCGRAIGVHGCVDTFTGAADSATDASGLSDDDEVQYLADDLPEQAEDESPLGQRLPAS